MTKPLASKTKTTLSSWIRTYCKELFYQPDWVAHVSWATLRADAIAGLTGATLVLPQGVAFAAIAGLPPEYGFYTAMITPVIAGMAGSSWHIVSGPTTAISVLVFGALAGSISPGSPEFISTAIMLTLLAGLFQLALGLAKLGGLVDFVSHSVMTGFVTSAALLIGITQIRHAAGLEIPRSEHLTEFMVHLWQALPNTNLHVLTISVLAFGVGLVVRKVNPMWPNYLIALVVATAAATMMTRFGVEIKTIGAIDSVVPKFLLPELSLDGLRDFGTAAIAIAIVGLLEAISISRAIAMRSGQILDGNREFLGQGASNLVGSLFQCYPGSASFTRSGVNFDSGARTPLSAAFSAVFLFVILILVAPLFNYVPLPGLAGVIVLVAWRLVDFREIKHIFTTSVSESTIALTTFAAALLFNLEVAIFSGVILSLALFLNRTARPFVGIGAPDPSTPQHMFRNADVYGLPECPQLLIARLDGPLYFGSVEYLRRVFRTFEIERAEQKHLVFIIKGGGEVDMPGADLMIEEAKRRSKRGGSFHLQIKSPHSFEKLVRFKVVKQLHKDHIHLSKQDAISYLVPTLDSEVCRLCERRIFKECGSKPRAAKNSIEAEEG